MLFRTTTCDRGTHQTHNGMQLDATRKRQSFAPYGAGGAGFRVTTGDGSREPTGPVNSSFVPSS
jgi:hypothetical protein